MDWIEQWLGFAPDAGDGTLEAMLVVVAVLVLVVVAMSLTRRGRRLLSRVAASVRRSQA